MADTTHSFCLYYRDNRLDVGWIEGLQKNKLIVQPLQGKTQFLAENRILFFWHPKSAASTLEQARLLLDAQLQQARAQQGEYDLETMHELCDPEQEQEFSELAELFLSDPEVPEAQLGLQLALLEDERWFKRTRDGRFVARSAEELAQLDARLERERAQQERAAQVEGWARELQEQTWDPEDWIEAQRTWVLQLEDLLAQGRDSIHWKELAPLLNFGTVLSPGEEQQIKHWLAQAGQPMSWSRLYLLRASVRERFPATVLSELPDLLSREAPAPDPEWTDLPTFTIDSAKTRDYDDALTLLEWSPQSLRLALHITDLSQVLAPESALFREAESRVSSVYTLEQTIPMLPEELSNEHFSLKAGATRPVLSYFFRLFRDGQWQFEEVRPQVIQVEENLSYEVADQLIEEGESFWPFLSRFCDALLHRRVDEGALNLPRKEFEFDLTDPQHLKLVPARRNSPSNRLVQELAVLVNRETGALFRSLELPGIYRTQAPDELVREGAEGDEMTLEHISIEGARLSTVPDRHSGLACEVYMQATSPIRRFTDLVTQMQLRSWWSEQTPRFSPEDMMRWAETCEVLQKQYGRAEREVLHHWKTSYLAQHVGDAFEARVRRPLPQQRLELELTELDYVFAVSGVGSLEKGDELRVQLELVDVEEHRISVRHCGEEIPLHRLNG